MTYILAIDQGTTSTRAIIFDENATPKTVSQKELKLHYPNKGWVEQDPEDIWSDTKELCLDVVKKYKNISALGITNQRETTLIWDRVTGKPVYNAIVWQDKRTSEYCRSLKEEGYEDLVQGKTGLLLDPYFSATKVKWILDNVKGACERAKLGELCFGTIDSFLIWKLTHGRSHVTDITNASRTMLFNIKDKTWDEDLCKLFDIPKEILPDVLPNVANFGVTDMLSNEAIPITGVAGDQQAAAIGQACFEKGMMKSTYGTGCFALMNIGTDFQLSKNKLLTTIAYEIGDDFSYALEGSIFIAGAGVQFLRDNLGFFENAAQSEKLALSVKDTNGVYFVPAFAGLGAPYWNADARGLICGLTRESNKAHITRAMLDAQAYQTYDLMDAMESDSGIKVAVIRIDGGLASNKYVCQKIADILDRQIDVPTITETTALGACYLAGLGVGIYRDLNDLKDRWALRKSYSSSSTDKARQESLEGWREALSYIS